MIPSRVDGAPRTSLVGLGLVGSDAGSDLGAALGRARLGPDRDGRVVDLHVGLRAELAAVTGWALRVFAAWCASTAVPNAPCAREVRGTATVYWTGDPTGTGARVGCPAEALRRYGTRDLSEVRRRAFDRDGLYVVAMRAELAPCGALVVVEHEGTGRTARGIVLDRGPYSCYMGTQRVTALRCQPGWKRKSIADLPLSMAKELGHAGLDRVIVRALTAAPSSSPRRPRARVENRHQAQPRRIHPAVDPGTRVRARAPAGNRATDESFSTPRRNRASSKRRARR